MIETLNLYGGIGGNRKLWQNVDVTMVEKEPKIAEIYHHFFPNDKKIATASGRQTVFQSSGFSNTLERF